MEKCAHPESLLGWCHRSAPCQGEACEWAAAQCHRETTDHTTSVYKNLNDWTHDEKNETLRSPCGRYSITRIRVTILGRRYSAWDHDPPDGDGLPALAGVSDSAPGALRLLT